MAKYMSKYLLIYTEKENNKITIKSRSFDDDRDFDRELSELLKNIYENEIIVRIYKIMTEDNELKVTELKPKVKKTTNYTFSIEPVENLLLK